MAVPAALAWLLVVMPWRSALGLIGGAGLLVAAAILLLLPRGLASVSTPSNEEVRLTATRPRHQFAFPLLLVIGMLDSGTRMGFLAFLPFILRGKGATTPIIGLARTLVSRGAGG